MVRTIVTPDHANIELAIPDDYIGKQLEVLIYTTEEVDEKAQHLIPLVAQKEAILRKKPSDFKGILRSDIVDEFQQYIKKSREEWAQRI